MSNRRILDYLAAADLARAQIERERQRGANEAARVKQIAGLATTVPGLIGSVVGAYGDSVNADAATAAQDLVARHKGDLGQRAEGPSEASGTIPYASTAGEEAARIVGADKVLTPEKPKGIAGFLADPLGWKESAAKRARAQATSHLAGSIDEGRADEHARERQRNQDAFTRSRLEAQDKTQAEDRDEKRLDALVKTSVAAGLARGFDDADILEQTFALADSQGFPVNETRVYAALDEQRRARSGAEVDEQFKRSQIERNEAQAKKAARTPTGSASSTATGKAADALRKEFNARPEIKTFNEVDTQFKKIKAAAAQPSAAGDIAMVFGYMKLLDPTSVVRESEYATAANAAGVPDQIRARWNRLLDGERLAPAQRQDFLQQAERYYDVHAAQADEVRARYADLARRRGLSPADVVSGGAAVPVPDFVIVTDGHETLQIPRSDLADAMRDGFREVQQ